MVMTAKQITVRPAQRVCINCQSYRRLLLETDVPGEAYKQLTAVSCGWCIRKEEQRGPLHSPCKDFEAIERSGWDKPALGD